MTRPLTSASRWPPKRSTARWPPDQRGLVGEPADLLELLDAAAETHDGPNCENPA
jgi:hypothetical protein